VYRILINSIINKLIEFSNNNKLEGNNSSLNTKHACCIINSRKLGNNAFILKYLTMLSNYIISKYNNNNISINITKS
jgi:hypothetical protein